MKKYHLFISILQKSITQNDLTSLVPNTNFNQKILCLLQKNGFIEGFKIVTKSRIVVYFKFRNNSNVIKSIYKFKLSHKYSSLNTSKWYKSVGLSYFTILSTRNGLVTNKESLLKGFHGQPILGLY